ncbi:MAG TPA: hypothetical protein VML55_15560, partial [Planctomycetaceae bacterium]|nr:hypothetical protein [Planctomycetaceae bacterium]
FTARRTPQALQAWRASLSRSTTHESLILDLAEQRVRFPDLVEQLLPADPRVLIRLARERYASADEASRRNLLLARAERNLKASDLPAAEEHYLRGCLQVLRSEKPQAIASFQQALALADDRADWRYELASLLRAAGRTQEALAQARLCAQFDRANPEYRTLFHELYREVNSAD